MSRSRPAHTAPPAAEGAIPSVTVALLVTTMVQALVSMAVLTPPVFAPEAARELGIDARYIGFYTGILYVASMFAAAMGGSVAHRFGPVLVSQGGLLLCAAGLALLALAQGPLLLVPAAFLIGIGYGPATPASSQILACCAPPERRSLIFSIKQTGVPLGAVFAGFLVPPLVLYDDWRFATLVTAGLCAVLAILIWPSRAKMDDQRDPETPIRLSSLAAALALVARSPGLRSMAICSFCFSGNQVVMATYFVIFLVTQAGYSLSLAGAALAVAQIGGVAMRIVSGHLADRFFGNRPTLIGMSVIIATSAVLFGLIGPDWPLWLVFAIGTLYGSFAAGWNGAFLAEVAVQAPDGQAGTATGGVLFVTFGGVVFWTSLFGPFLTLVDSFSIAFAAMGAVVLFGGLTILVSTPRKAVR